MRASASARMRSHSARDVIWGKAACPRPAPSQKRPCQAGSDGLAGQDRGRKQPDRFARRVARTSKSAEAANSGVVGTGPGRSGPALRSPGASAEGGGPAAALAPAASRRRLSPPPLLELLVMLERFCSSGSDEGPHLSKKRCRCCCSYRCCC